MFAKFKLLVLFLLVGISSAQGMKVQSPSKLSQLTDFVKERKYDQACALSSTLNSQEIASFMKFISDDFVMSNLSFEGIDFIVGLLRILPSFTGDVLQRILSIPHIYNRSTYIHFIMKGLYPIVSTDIQKNMVCLLKDFIFWIDSNAFLLILRYPIDKEDNNTESIEMNYFNNGRAMGHIAARIVAYKAEKIAKIDFLVIKDSADRNKNHGSILLTHGLKYLKTLGCKKIMLLASPLDYNKDKESYDVMLKKLINFYVYHGFKRDYPGNISMTYDVEIENNKYINRAWILSNHILPNIDLEGAEKKQR